MFISFNKHSTQMRDVDNEGGYSCVEVGNTWEISVSFPKVYCEHKTALKKLSFNLKKLTKNKKKK